MYVYIYICIGIYIYPPQRTPLDTSKLITFTIWAPFRCTGPLETCLVPSSQILTLGNALQLELCPFFNFYFSATLYSLINEILLSRAPGHIQSCFGLFYYYHVGEKSESGYTT